MYMYIHTYVCVHVYKNFCATLDKGLGKNNNKKGDAEIGKIR